MINARQRVREIGRHHGAGRVARWCDSQAGAGQARRDVSAKIQIGRKVRRERARQVRVHVVSEHVAGLRQRVPKVMRVVHGGAEDRICRFAVAVLQGVVRRAGERRRV